MSVGAVVAIIVIITGFLMMSVIIGLFVIDDLENEKGDKGEWNGKK